MNIKDIAKLAGVSLQLYQNLSNKDQTISKETRERVLKSFEITTTHLTQQISSQIVLQNLRVIINSHETLRLGLRALLIKLKKNGYNCLILNSHGSLEQELKNITSPTLKQASGIIWDPINENSKQYAKFIEELTIPYYFVNHSTNELPS